MGHPSVVVVAFGLLVNANKTDPGTVLLPSQNIRHSTDVTVKRTAPSKVLSDKEMQAKNVSVCNCVCERERVRERERDRKTETKTDSQRERWTLSDQEGKQERSRRQKTA